MLTSSQKVFDVLEFLCANGPHKALEVSKALSLQKSSVHRFLNSLIEFGYVRKDDQTGLFSVTLKVVQLGAMVSSKIDMVETGRSYMRELVATFDQATVSFATFMDKQVLVLRREYPRNCVTRIDLSQQLPAYCTGLGKALLSTKSEEEIDEYIATVPRTAYTLQPLPDGARPKQDRPPPRKRDTPRTSPKSATRSTASPCPSSPRTAGSGPSAFRGIVPSSASTVWKTS